MNEVHDGYKRFVRRQSRVWIVVAVVALVAELFFDVIEVGIGRYLSWQNAGREKIGRSWEAAQSRLLADSRVEAAQQEIRRRAGSVVGITDFAQLVEYVRANQQALLPLSQFNSIHRSLPEIFQPLLVPAEVLMQYVRDARVTNALCAFRQSTFEIFLVDAQDRAAYQSRLSGEEVQMIIQHGREQQLDVTRSERFGQRVFPAADFYRALEQLSHEERGWLLRQLPILTDPDGRFVRIAVSDRMTGGFVEIAFALDAQRSRIYFLPEEQVVEFLLPALNENSFRQFE